MNYIRSIILTGFVCGIISVLSAQQSKKPGDYEKLMTKAAHEIIETSKYCALITLDQTGHPQARTMQPFPPEVNMVIWFGTNPNSRKVEEIKNDSRVTLYYGDPSGDGYVTIIGNAFLINDPAEKNKRWNEEWDAFYPDRNESYLLIKVIPENMEVVSYKHGLTGDKITWRAPSIQLNKK